MVPRPWLALTAALSLLAATACSDRAGGSAPVVGQGDAADPAGDGPDDPPAEPPPADGQGDDVGDGQGEARGEGEGEGEPADPGDPPDDGPWIPTPTLLNCPCPSDGPEDCDACIQRLFDCCLVDQDEFVRGRFSQAIEGLAGHCAGMPECAACCDECAALPCDEVRENDNCPMRGSYGAHPSR